MYPNSACCMYNINEEKLDKPIALYCLHDTCVLKKLIDEKDYAGVKAIGFYACKENILLDLDYLDKHGMLMALP